MAVFAEGVGGRRWGEVVERNERVGQSACALAWEKPDGLASGRERETVKMGKVERRRVWMGKEKLKPLVKLHICIYTCIEGMPGMADGMAVAMGTKPGPPGGIGIGNPPMCGI